MTIIIMLVGKVTATLLQCSHTVITSMEQTRYYKPAAIFCCLCSDIDSLWTDLCYSDCMNPSGLPVSKETSSAGNTISSFVTVPMHYRLGKDRMIEGSKF